MNPSVERDKGGSRFVPFVGKCALVLFEKQVNFPLFSKKREPLDSSARIQITTVHAHSVWFFETPVTHTRDRLHWQRRTNAYTDNQRLCVSTPWWGQNGCPTAGDLWQVRPFVAIWPRVWPLRSLQESRCKYCI